MQKKLKICHKKYSKYFKLRRKKLKLIFQSQSDNVGLNGYNFAYETSDGTSRQEQAELKNVGTENEALVVRGTIRCKCF